MAEEPNTDTPSKTVEADANAAVPPAAPSDVGVELLVKPPEMGDGASHYDRTSMLFAKAGEPVARAATPEAAAAAVGEGVELASDGVTLLATAAGRVVLSEGRVAVERALVIERHVDFATGNVSF